MAERLVVHCWADYRSQFEEYSDEWVASFATFPDNATCMLEDGHEGPHLWTSDAGVVITFRPPEES